MPRVHTEASERSRVAATCPILALETLEADSYHRAVAATGGNHQIDWPNSDSAIMCTCGQQLS